MSDDKGNNQIAEVEFITGSTGCGKTTHLRKRLNKQKRKRTIIWSPKEAIDNYAAFYAGSVLVRTATEVLNICKAAGAKGEFHIVFVPRLERKTDQAQFDAVCKIAKLARNLTFVVDELHTVTLPSWSPAGWSQLTMMGRGYGIKIFGLSQRPASVDKNFYGNLSTLHTGRLSYDDDCKCIAKTLAVPVTEVQALTGYKWIERNIHTGQVTRG
ncbi:MAG: hypothetical protein ACXWJD_04010 [Burkholderiaceae bacterium]